MMDLYLVFRFVKGRRLILLAFFALSLEIELQFHCLNVRINSGDDVATYVKIELPGNSRDNGAHLHT